MNWSVTISNILSGGMLKGKRTAIIAIILVLGLLGQYLTGDLDLISFLRASWEQIAIAFGLVTAAASGNSNS